MTRSALRRAATIVAAKGGLISNITVVDCLELELLQGGGMRRTNRGVGLYGLPSGRWKNPHAGDRGRRRVRCAREDLARTKEIRRRKSWIGQRTVSVCPHCRAGGPRPRPDPDRRRAAAYNSGPTQRQGPSDNRPTQRRETLAPDSGKVSAAMESPQQSATRKIE